MWKKSPAKNEVAAIFEDISSLNKKRDDSLSIFRETRDSLVKINEELNEKGKQLHFIAEQADKALKAINSELNINMDTIEKIGHIFKV